MYRVEQTLVLTNLETGEESKEIISWENTSLESIQRMSNTLVMENSPDLLERVILNPNFVSPKKAAPAKPAVKSSEPKKNNAKKDADNAASKA